jgi:hypothetical protein
MPKMIGDIKLFTLLELSKILGTTDVTLRRYIRSGKLKAQKIAGAYHVTEESFKEFANGVAQVKR